MWTRAALGDGDDDHHRTLKPGSSASVEGATLPRLTLGEPVAGGGPHAELELVSVLGEGGMGVVWLARQASLGREVAIKRVRPDAPPAAARALLREARVLGALEHPNIVPVHALGVDDEGAPVLVMKRVDGVSWQALVDDPGHPWWAEQGDPDRLGRHVEILLAVCRSVQFAHAHGVLHRDLKPDNVMIGRFGEVWLMDWGVARPLAPTEPGEVDGAPRRHVVGTPAYMAPELLDLTMPLGWATDVYLLGACLHAVLTGRPPHAGATLEAVMRSVHASAPPELPPSVPPALAEVARKALARDPSRRYATVAELAGALERFLRHRAAHALADAAAGRLRELRRAGSEEGPRVDALLAECRFGFRQALQVAPDLSVASDGLREALALVVGHHLRRGDAEGARALTDELEALGGEVAELRRAIDAVLAEREAERRHLRDTELTTTAGARAVAVGASALLFAALAVVVLRRPELYSHRAAFYIMVISHLVLWIGVAVGWRIAVRNSASRRLVGLLFGFGFAGITHRAIAWHFETPIAAMLATDLVILASGVAASGLSLGPRTVLASLPFVVGIPLVVGFPDAAPQLFGVFGTLGVTAFAAALMSLWRRER